MGIFKKGETSFAHIPNNTASSWWKDPGLRVNVFHLFGCLLCPFYLGYDQSLLAGLQAIPGWSAYFHKPAGQFLGLIAAMIFIPAIPGAFFGEFLTKRFGAKKLIWFGTVVIIAAAIFQSQSKNRGQFMGSRAMLGAGGVFVKVAAPVLLQEIAHPRLRATVGTMYWGFYHIGSLAAAIMNIVGLHIKGEWSWRFPVIFQIIGPAFVIVFTATAPESPRWLCKHGQPERAKAILTKYHANGDADDPLVEWEFAEIQAVLAREEAAQQTSYLDFFRTPGNRKRLWINAMLGLLANWVGNGIITYYLAPVLRTVGVTDPNKITAINAGFAFWNLLTSLIAGVNSEKFGRRPLWLTSNIGMAFSFAFIMGLSAGFAKTGHASIGLAVIPFLFIAHMFYNIAYIALNYSYSIEILPFSLRSKGLAVYICFNNLGNAFNQFANPIALKALAWKYYAVYIAVDLAAATVIYFTFPETNHMSIEEISLVMDFPLKDCRRMAIEQLHRDVQEHKGATDPQEEGEGEKERVREHEIA